MTKVVVAHGHDPADLSTIFLAVVPGKNAAVKPAGSQWRAAYRDMVGDQKVVWARFEEQGTVWLRDGRGERIVSLLAYT